jgi:hypothetical protein
MHQTDEWLKQLGLEQYAQRFAENDISFVILPDLTDQDLEKIGVASLGHRRQLLRAIAELKGAPERGTAAAGPVAPHDTAERRQVTDMFSDLVGSTALSGPRRPARSHFCLPDVRCRDCARFGGFVAKYMATAS